MEDSRQLPEEVFQLIEWVYSHFLKLWVRCKLDPTEFYALAHIKKFGKEHKNRTIILRADLLDVLSTALGYKNRSGASNLITRLESKRFIKRDKISPETKAVLFDEGRGNLVYVLLKNGDEKLYQVKKEANRIFADLSEGISDAYLIPILNKIKEVSGLTSLISSRSGIRQDR